MKSRFKIGMAFFCMSITVMLSCQHVVQFPKSTSTGTGGGTGTTDTTKTTTKPPPITSTGNSCSTDTVYFVNTILPLLTSNCSMSGCHSMNTYAGAKKYVTAGNASGSRMVSEISAGRMPPSGHTPLTAAQLGSIETWINQGALDNSCTSTACDTTNVSYANTIVPILQTNCTGCHSGSASSGAGIVLTSYANVLTEVQSGKLWGDVSHASGYNAMPLGGNILSSCDLNMIYSWIQKGAPNN